LTAHESIEVLLSKEKENEKGSVAPIETSYRNYGVNTFMIAESEPDVKEEELLE